MTASIHAQKAFGLSVMVLLAALAATAHELSAPVSAITAATALGVIAGNLVGTRTRAAMAPGVHTAARTVLRAGVALLGFRLSFEQIGSLGGAGLVLVVLTVTATLLGTMALGRAMGVEEPLALLVGTGFAICGASAVAAAEPVSGADREQVATAVALVTMCGTAAMVVLPVLGTLLGLDDRTFGSWVGASVHDVGQVVATASTRSTEALTAATVIKLTRVLMLAPVVTVLGLRHRRRVVVGTHSPSVEARPMPRPPLVPGFVVAFLMAVAWRSSPLWEPSWTEPVLRAEELLLAIGMAALGFGVDIRRLRLVGRRPIQLGLASWAVVAVGSLMGVVLVGL